MIRSIKDFLMSCPALADLDINVNCLSEAVVSASVDSVSVDSVSEDSLIKTYTDGATVRQMYFDISLRQDYGDDVGTNSNAIGTMQQIADWIDGQNRVGILPKLSGNRSALSIEATASGYPDEKSTDTASYRLRCRLVYYQE